MESIKLSVDNKHPNGLMALTSNIELLLKNKELAKPLLDKYPKQHPMCFIAGRFMSFQFLLPSKTDNTKGHFMQIFCDLRKNRREAEYVCDNFIKEDDRDLFMELFEKSLNNYDKDYDEVELVLDETVPPSLFSQFLN